MRIRFSLFILAALAITASAAEKFRFERPLMGTRFTIVCYASNRASAAQAAESAFAIATDMNAMASDYLQESELSRLASQPADVPAPLSQAFCDLLGHSLRLAQATDGAFDPTLGTLTKLWRETRDLKRLPDPMKLEAARTASGWENCILNPTTRSITLKRASIAFDLGGVAKGYVADLMLESLVAAGIPQAMIAAGGDIRLGDPPPDRDGWHVALQTFDPAKADEVIILANAAVSTSGDLHQSVEIDGIKYSHILNPSTGLGLTRRIATSVIADEAKLSDPLATAACVLGPDAAEALRKMPGVREVRIRVLQESTSDSRLIRPNPPSDTP